MSIFNFMKQHQAKNTPAPVRMPALVAPEKVPTTLDRFPADFVRYTYVGPAIASYKDRMGNSLRGLCAEISFNRYSPDGGASSRLTMVVSLSDLVAGNHPQAGYIDARLDDFYKTKIPAMLSKTPPKNYAVLKSADPVSIIVSTPRISGGLQRVPA